MRIQALALTLTQEEAWQRAAREQWRAFHFLKRYEVSEPEEKTGGWTVISDQLLPESLLAWEPLGLELSQLRWELVASKLTGTRISGLPKRRDLTAAQEGGVVYPDEIKALKPGRSYSQGEGSFG